MDNRHFCVMIAGIAKNGMEEYLKNYLSDMMHHSRKDSGCLAYNIHQSKDNPNEFMMYSVWTDEQAFIRHNSRPEMLEFKKKLATELFEHESPKTFWLLLD